MELKDNKKEIKVIGLLPVKNEGWVLKAMLQSIKPVCDEIIAINDGSTDNTQDILNEFGTHTVNLDMEAKESGWREYEIRNRLLEEGRKHGGTHFVCLDGDEAFSYSLQQQLPTLIKNMIPGDSLCFRWATLWKNSYTERIDGVFKELFKDFIFCDNKTSNHPYVALGVSRTPLPHNRIEIKDENFFVMHYQYVNWKASQLKQAWYRCSELLEGKRSARRINYTYEYTLDSSRVKTRRIPEREYHNLSVPEMQNNPSWHLEKLSELFDTYGVKKFEPLEIWHIEELRNRFMKDIGHNPLSQSFPEIVKFANGYKNKVKQLVVKLKSKLSIRKKDTENKDKIVQK